MAKETCKILLVEDNPPDVRSLERLLSASLAGAFSLELAGTLQQGLAVLRTQDVDVVLLDLSLPDSTGMETLEAVRHEALEVAIVVLSGHDDESLAERALEFGVQDYLVKGEASGRKMVRTIRYAIERKRSLRVSQAHSASIINSALDCIVILDGDGQIREFNPAAQRTFGYTRTEAVGRSLCDLILPPEHHPTHLGCLSRLQRPPDNQSHGQRLEIPAQRADGGRMIVELTVVRHALEEPPLFTAFLRDITARRQAEEELGWKTAFLEALVSSTSDGMLVVDQQGGKILQNQRFNDVFKIPEEIVQDKQAERQIPWVIGMTTDPAQFVLRVAHLRANPDESDWDEIELTNGTVLDCHSAPVIGKDQHHFGRIWTFRDITERVRTAKSLRESEARYERIAANVPGMVHQFVIRADGGYAFPFVSDGCYEIYGVEPEQLLVNADLCTDMTHPDDKAGLEQALADSAATLQPLRWEGRIVRPDTGEIRCIQAASRPDRQANGDMVWDGVVMDITERKQAEEDRRAKEEAERANNAKSEFLSRMSHELRTPLNAILGFTQLLELDAETEKQQESVRHIMSGGRHLLRLVDEVLDIARVDSGQISMSPEAVAIGELVQEAIMLINPLAAQRGIALRIEEQTGNFAAAHDLHVVADRHRLKQVLLNLLSNAVKYNVPGGVVTLDYVFGPEFVRLRVADTGPGIPNAMRSRLFTPFDRLGAERGGVEGTGLGLSVSKRLMETMGGQLDLEECADGTSAANGKAGGAVFWLELPRVASPLEAHDSERVDAGDGLSRLVSLPAQRTLLYIEDNFSNFRLIERLLEAYPDVRLLAAAEGRLGVELAALHRPDLILLDLHLPDMEGWEVLAQLRAEEGSRETPVVVISADATERQIERMRQAGIHAYLTKPLNVKAFLAIVREVLVAA